MASWPPPWIRHCDVMRLRGRLWRIGAPLVLHVVTPIGIGGAPIPGSASAGPGRDGSGRPFPSDGFFVVLPVSATSCSGGPKGGGTHMGHDPPGAPQAGRCYFSDLQRVTFATRCAILGNIESELLSLNKIVRIIYENRRPVLERTDMRE